MGMAASQARYLSLSARKTNVEYEGQQINQERVVLANRTADLFNQMLSAEVPTCPDSNDYTTVQYSWSDGINDSVLSDYYQLGTADEEYNYVVTSYHYEDVYTGSRKLLNDPKVQASRDVEFVYDSTSAENNKKIVVKGCTYDFLNDEYKITNDKSITTTYTRVDDTGENRQQLDAIYDRTNTLDAKKFEADAGGNLIYHTGTDDGSGTEITYTYTPVDMTDPDAVQKLKDTYGAEYDENETYYYNADNNDYVVASEIIERAQNAGKASNIEARKQTSAEAYYTDGTYFISATELAAITPENSEITVKNATEIDTFYNFTAVGNCALSQLTEKDFEDEDVKAEIDQIIKDMNGENGSVTAAENFAKCFDSDGNYIGGIYSFKMNGHKYYTTVDDLTVSAQSAYDEKATATNGIDSQHTKMAYYNATYLNTKVEETSKALLETDGKGRFSSVRFEDDSVVYTLNTETITDEDAYENAMNQYYYKQEKYDKAIADINAKTELIQAQDRTLELRLKQLDTEQNALQTEMEAVKKVISKNVETTFKTFSGG